MATEYRRRIAATPPQCVQALPSTAHPTQVEAPEGYEDQGQGAYAQQQYDRFQHARITPLVSQKHARLPRNCHHSVHGNTPDETIFRSDENVLKQSAANLVGKKTGTFDMQVIFDFIWKQSRNRFLAGIGEQEAGQ